ncbi:SRPBCC family protein [Microbacterium sp. CIAB417]|uniref:SRPBCC family protein n=1 Tax=Microbacterium sp. CIAB417 TaxID=2860287 RepID=UPI0027E30657|nr:SRPBCC family protein [Microbacterium sp. CIAB417]
MGPEQREASTRRGNRARNVRVLHCTVEDVFDVLSDGWLYPSWVVGASRMRHVENGWPAGGARLHHSFGVWPLLIDDTTRCLEWDPPRKAVLRARGWPIGEAEILIEAQPRGDGCVVRIQERPVRGPAAALPAVVSGALLRWRNAETLHRLGYLAESGAGARRSNRAWNGQEDGMHEGMTPDEKRHDQLTTAPEATEEDAEARVVTTEEDGVTRVDIAPDAAVRPGPGPGMPEADEPPGTR